MAVLARLTGLQRMIRSWRTDQPTELASQLEDHQREVDEALRRVGAGAWPRLRERVVSGGAPTPVQPGELILAETWSQSATLTLPQIGGDMLGAVCGVAKLRTENEVRVFATRGRVDGVLRAASPLRIAGTGMRLFVATSKGWWSFGGELEGEYSPTVSNEDNLGVGTASNVSHLWRLRNRVVSVDGRITLTASGSGQKSFEITLPINPSSVFPDAHAAHGPGSMVAGDLATDCQAASVQAVTGANRVRVASASSATSGARAFRYHFVYRL